MKKGLRCYLPVALYLMASLTMSSCFIQKNAPLSSLSNYRNGTDYRARTIYVPVHIAKPFVNMVIKKDGDDEELRRLIKKYPLAGIAARR